MLNIKKMYDLCGKVKNRDISKFKIEVSRNGKMR
jgi:hypothetical protein